MPSFWATFGGDANPLRKELTSIERAAAKTGSTVSSSIGKAIANAFMVRFGGFAAVFRGMGFLRDAIKVDVAMQSMFNTLKAVSGSAAQATEDIEFLKSSSNDLGFSFLESGRDFARLSVAAKASNFTLDETRKLFLSVQQAAIVMGLTTEQSASVMLALEQMLSKGTVMSQELRLQLGNAMPGAINIFARALGVSQKDLLKFVEDGVVPAKEAVKLFGEELNNAFKLTPEANKTQRDLVRMTNSIIEMKAALGETLRPEVTAGAEAVGFWAKQSATPGSFWGNLGRAITGIDLFRNFVYSAQILGADTVAGGESAVGESRATLIKRRQEKLKQIAEAEAAKKAMANRLTGASVAKLEEELLTKREKAAFAQMDNEGKINELLRRRNSIYQAGLDTLSKTGRIQAAIDIEEIDAQIAGLRSKKTKDPRSGMPSVTDWQKHGAFTFDPVVDIGKQQLNELKGIRADIKRQGAGVGGATF